MSDTEENSSTENNTPPKQENDDWSKCQDEWVNIWTHMRGNPSRTGFVLENLQMLMKNLEEMDTSTDPLQVSPSDISTIILATAIEQRLLDDITVSKNAFLDEFEGTGESHDTSVSSNFTTDSIGDDSTSPFLNALRHHVDTSPLLLSSLEYIPNTIEKFEITQRRAIELQIIIHKAADALILQRLEKTSLRIRLANGIMGFLSLRFFFDRLFRKRRERPSARLSEENEPTLAIPSNPPPKPSPQPPENKPSRKPRKPKSEPK